MDKINFQSRTVLITSPQKYVERVSTISYPYERPVSKHMEPGIARKCELNDGDLFVLVHNGTEGMLRRIEYNIQLGAKNIIDNVCEDLQNFSNGIKENITCIIMGGRSNDSVTTKCVNDIANRVEKHLADYNKKGDLSIICGLTDELDSPIFVAFRKGGNIPEVYIPANVEGEVSAEKLEDVFDMVELNNIDLVG